MGWGEAIARMFGGAAKVELDRRQRAQEMLDKILYAQKAMEFKLTPEEREAELARKRLMDAQAQYYLGRGNGDGASTGRTTGIGDLLNLAQRESRTLNSISSLFGGGKVDPKSILAEYGKYLFSR